MSVGWICNSDYYDGVHKVKHKLTGDESYIELECANLKAEHMYDVVDCKTRQEIKLEDYDHIIHYENGNYFECSEHEGVWLFDDGDEVFDECPECKSLEDEISNFKVAEDVYQYNNNREFNRLKYLLKADKYRFWNDGKEGGVKPKQGLFILITEYDSDGDEYYYYKTIEKSFIDELKWSVK